MKSFESLNALHAYITGTEPNATQIREHVRPSATLSPEERADIYRRMYKLRITEAIRDDYPIVESFVGETEFDDLAMAFVEAYPSTGYSLNSLGKLFPQFLLKRSTFEFLPQVAEVEWAMVEVFHAPISKPIKTEGLNEELISQWMEKSFQCSSSLRLLTLNFDINSTLDQYFNDTEITPPAKALQNLAIYRTHEGIFRMEIPSCLSLLLGKLKTHEKFGSAVDEVISHPDFLSQSSLFFERLHLLISDGCLYESN